MDLNEALETLKGAGFIVESKDYMSQVIAKLAAIRNHCYDEEDRGYGYANRVVDEFDEKQIKEMEEEGIPAVETAEVIWVKVHNNRLYAGRKLRQLYAHGYRQDPDFFHQYDFLDDEE